MCILLSRCDHLSWNYDGYGNLIVSVSLLSVYGLLESVCTVHVGSFECTDAFCIVLFLCCIVFPLNCDTNTILHSFANLIIALEHKMQKRKDFWDGKEWRIQCCVVLCTIPQTCVCFCECVVVGGIGWMMAICKLTLIPLFLQFSTKLPIQIYKYPLFMCWYAAANAE